MIKKTAFACWYILTCVGYAWLGHHYLAYPQLSAMSLWAALALCMYSFFRYFILKDEKESHVLHMCIGITFVVSAGVASSPVDTSDIMPVMALCYLAPLYMKLFLMSPERVAEIK